MSLENLAFDSVERTDPFAVARAASKAVEKPEVTVNILALDLGIHTGYAVLRRDGSIVHGTESFSRRKGWSPGQPWQRYRTLVVELIVHNQVNRIAYENVRRHMGTEAAHVYGAFRAILEMLADSHNLELIPCEVGHVKQYWTGSGAAKKDVMVAEAKRRGFRPDSDNSADAIAILHLAIAKETGLWKEPPKRPKPKRSVRPRPAQKADLFSGDAP